MRFLVPCPYSPTPYLPFLPHLISAPLSLFSRSLFSSEYCNLPHSHALQSRGTPHSLHDHDVFLTDIHQHYSSAQSHQPSTQLSCPRYSSSRTSLSIYNIPPIPLSFLRRRNDKYQEPKIIYLIGTSHVSEKSARDVERVIKVRLTLC